MVNDTLSTGFACYRSSGRFHSYEDVLRHLDGLGLFHMDMGLGRMQRVLDRLGIHRLPCPVVQVVGTNGKGSTAAFLTSLAAAHGFRVGLYTSPHFVSPAERIRMAGKMLPQAAWPDLAERACSAEPDLTYFELLTVMAVLAFQDAEPDLLIFEAGLGGRYDATTAIPTDMVCFTPFALDHQDVLGPDLAAIAADKADAMRPGIFAAVGANPNGSDPAIRSALLRRSAQTNVPLCFASLPGAWPEICADALSEALSDALVNDKGHGLLSLAHSADLGLEGPHQRVNAATALTAWLLLCRNQGWGTDERAIRRGLSEAFIPGRMQRVEAQQGWPPFLLDGAHNPHGMAALAAALADGDTQREARPAAVVFSCLADKQPERLTGQVAELAGDAPVFVPAIRHNSRAASPQELAALLNAARARATPCADLAEALEAARRARETRNAAGPVLVCGSLYLLSEFFQFFPSTLR